MLLLLSTTERNYFSLCSHRTTIKRKEALWWQLKRCMYISAYSYVSYKVFWKIATNRQIRLNYESWQNCGTARSNVKSDNISILKWDIQDEICTWLSFRVKRCDFHLAYKTLVCVTLKAINNNVSIDSGTLAWLITELWRFMSVKCLTFKYFTISFRHEQTVQSESLSHRANCHVEWATTTLSLIIRVFQLQWWRFILFCCVSLCKAV